MKPAILHLAGSDALSSVDPRRCSASAISSCIVSAAHHALCGSRGVGAGPAAAAGRPPRGHHVGHDRVDKGQALDGALRAVLARCYLRLNVEEALLNNTDESSEMEEEMVDITDDLVTCI